MIILKSRQEIASISRACRIVAEALEEIKGLIKPGTTTAEIDNLVEGFIRKKGGVPAFKGYRGFPNSICTSINEQVVHGIPSDRKLIEGDIISLDLGVIIDGYYGDAAVTFPVGEVSLKALRLLKVTEASLYAGIEKAIIGNRVSDISCAIQTLVEKEGFSVVRDFVGHGIGRYLHEEPQIPNFGEAGHGARLKEGMTLAIEPMVNAGDYRTTLLNDKWTAVTVDGELSAHFEHTIAVTSDGPLILTKCEMI